MPGDDFGQDLDAQLLAQMLRDFLEESQEHLDRLNLQLTRLEDSPEDEELINEIFRTAHTLKGSASFVGLDAIKEVAHKMEDVFGAIRKGGLKVSAPIVDIMFEGIEVLDEVRSRALAEDPTGVDISGIVHRLEGVLSVTDREGEVDSCDGLVLLQPEGEDGQTVEPAPCAPREPSGRMLFSSETIRVSTHKLDSLMNLVGELITSRNRLNGFADRFRNDELAAITSEITRLTAQTHTSLMSIRMVPIERLFNKFPGVVRNLARERSKEVELSVEGKETELDKTVIEQVYDPLVHLLRNAVDHGIEDPKERVRLGKHAAGRVRLASWHRQGTVVIEVSDDGRGIDPERMKAVAVQRGIVSHEEARGMSDDQAIHLIFAPGFSTSERVTEVSGRGVGMDIVKEHIQKLRGMVDVRTSLGKGTTFQIQLPLTLAILQVLLVKSCGLHYGLPINAVSETMLLPASEIQTMEKSEVVFLRGRAFPVKRFDRIFRGGGAAPAPANGVIPVVVVGLAEKKVALCVDELMGKQEVVMKSLGDYLGRVKGIEGAAILADGSVTPIVDVEILLR